MLLEVKAELRVNNGKKFLKDVYIFVYIFKIFQRRKLENKIKLN